MADADEPILGMTAAQAAAGALGPGPWRWTVTWGSWLRSGFDAEQVEAWDVDEALEIARRRRPDLPTPRTAFIARQEELRDEGTGLR